jgi:hypothetical protein
MIDIKSLTNDLYDLLLSADSSIRANAIKAAMVMLDDTANLGVFESSKINDVDGELGSTNINTNAKTWMKKHNVSANQLQQVFHVKGDQVNVIIDAVPGTSSKQKTIKAYVLIGLGQLLVTGEAKFTDKSARDFCRLVSCLDDANHAKYIREKGKSFTGSKKIGWTLTHPGLAEAADLVKGLANSEA